MHSHQTVACFENTFRSVKCPRRPPTRRPLPPGGCKPSSATSFLFAAARAVLHPPAKSLSDRAALASASVSFHPRAVLASRCSEHRPPCSAALSRDSLRILASRAHSDKPLPCLGNNCTPAAFAPQLPPTSQSAETPLPISRFVRAESRPRTETHPFRDRTARPPSRRPRDATRPSTSASGGFADRYSDRGRAPQQRPSG